jgi:hypothetical protein
LVDPLQLFSSVSIVAKLSGLASSVLFSVFFQLHPVSYFPFAFFSMLYLPISLSLSLCVSQVRADQLAWHSELQTVLTSLQSATQHVGVLAEKAAAQSAQTVANQMVGD